MPNFTMEVVDNPLLLCKELILSCIHRGKEFGAKTIVSYELIHYTTPENIDLIFKHSWEMLRHELEKCIAKYDEENPPKYEVTKLSYQAYMSKEMLAQAEEDQKMFHGLLEASLQNAYAAKSTFYKNKATSEFEGVEDLDPTLWNDDGDDLA